MNAIIALSATGLLTLFASTLRLRGAVVWIALLGLAASGFLLWSELGKDVHYWGDMLFFDRGAVWFSLLVVALTGLVLFHYFRPVEILDVPLLETVTLLVFAALGAVLMVSFSHMAMLFLGIEILSISLYILAGSKKREAASNEAALKYFLMGAFATGLLLFGITLVYGATGSFHIEKIAAQVSANASSPLLNAGILLILAGLAFKISAAPFHFWTPDVYQGTPSGITAFMATVVKTAGIFAILRLFFVAFAASKGLWSPVLLVLSATTILLGNLAALRQTSVKRTLAYSSIAHAGYLLMAVGLPGDRSASILWFYTLVYSVSTITAFVGLLAVQKISHREDFEGFNGLAKTRPFLAFCLAVAMLSLSGIPPAAGFFAKFYLFTNAVNQGALWLVLVALLGSALSLAYYFKLIFAMYLRPSETSTSETAHWSEGVVLAVCLLATLALGIYPAPFLKLF